MPESTLSRPISHPIETPSNTGALLAAFRADHQHDLANQWSRWLTEQVQVGQLAQETVNSYTRGLRPWLVFLDTVARTDTPSPAVVAAYLAALIPGRQPGTVNVHLAALRAFYRWTESGDHFADVARAARPLRVHRDGPLPCLGHAAVAALVAGITGTSLKALRDRALLATLYGTAVRTVSLARATVGDLDLGAPTLRHHPKGHRGVDALAYLPAGAHQMLTAYLTARRQVGTVTDDQPLFIALDHRTAGAPLTTYSMRAVVRAAMERAGHARRGSDGRLLSPGIFSAHSLRRSALTTAADAHGLEAARAVAGHSSVEVTRRAYVRSKLDGQMRQVAAVLDLTPVSDASGDC